MTLKSLSQVPLDAQGTTEDQELVNGVHIVQERVSALEYCHSHALRKWKY